MTRPPDQVEIAIRKLIHADLRIDVAFTLKPELNVLFGASGAGKTTILQLIAGLVTPDEGKISANDMVFFDRSRRINRRLRDRRVGYVFQHDALFPHLTVAENLRYGLNGQPAAVIRDRVGAICAGFGIGGLLDRRVATLSGGERQRVGLARAVAPRPRLLLCDEPVSALDRDARFLVLTRLQEFQRAEGMPVLLVTHAFDEAIRFGDRLFLLDRGRIINQGRPDQVLDELLPGASQADQPLRNIFPGVIAAHDLGQRSSTIALEGGPPLIVSAVDHALGTPVFVRINADEIVLARNLAGTLSARNLISGTVERIVTHQGAAEALIRVGSLVWKVGIIAATVPALGLLVGAEVTMIIKARSCRVLTAELR